MLRLFWLPIVCIGIGIPLILVRTFVTIETESLYSYVPEECDVIIHVNNRSIAKKVMLDWLYHTEAAKEVFEDFGDQVEKSRPGESGFDMLSPVVLAHEAWSEGELWYAFISVQNPELVKQEELGENIHMRFNDQVAVFAVAHGVEKERVDERLALILNKEIRSIENRLDIDALLAEEHDVYMVSNPTLWSPQIGELVGVMDLEDGKITASFDGLLSEKPMETAWAPQSDDMPFIFNSTVELDLAKGILDTNIRFHPMGLSFDHLSVQLNASTDIEELDLGMEGWTAPENMTWLDRVPSGMEQILRTRQSGNTREIVLFNKESFWYNSYSKLLGRDSTWTASPPERDLTNWENNLVYLNFSPRALNSAMEIKLGFLSLPQFAVISSAFGPLENVHFQLDHESDRIKGELTINYDAEGVNAVFSAMEMMRQLTKAMETAGAS